MKYDVNVYSENDQIITNENGLTKTGAMSTAAKYAAKYQNHQVFIEWHRESDGQHGYLNPDGDHAITGKAW